MFDVAIIGGGPAGVSAAINLKLLGKTFVWLSNQAVSKKVTKAELIKNYPGLPEISGSQLGWTFKNHYEAMGIKLQNATVAAVYDTGDNFTVSAGDNEYEAKAVILCVGVQSAKPYAGEEDFVGRGVSYCATCDGFLYRGKNIAVISTDKAFEHEIEYLCNLAAAAYVIPLYRDYNIQAPNAKIILKPPVKFTGDSRIKKAEFKDGAVEVDGVFILRGTVPPSTLVRGLLSDNNGHIEVKRDCSTNIAGIFAAGDCTGRPYQYIKAAGEGNVAAHSAVEYLAKLK